MFHSHSPVGAVVDTSNHRADEFGEHPTNHNQPTKLRGHQLVWIQLFSHFSQAAVKLLPASASEMTGRGDLDTSNVDSGGIQWVDFMGKTQAIYHRFWRTRHKMQIKWLLSVYWVIWEEKCAGAHQTIRKKNSGDLLWFTSAFTFLHVFFYKLFPAHTHKRIYIYICVCMHESAWNWTNFSKVCLKTCFDQRDAHHIHHIHHITFW